MTTNAGGMLVAAPESWDEACFAVSGVRALAASGLRTGVLCPEMQREFWETVEGITVLHFPLKAKAKVVAAAISGNWEASLAWEYGFAADVFKIAGISQRIGVDERKLKKLLTHPLAFQSAPLEHRVQHYLSAMEALGVATGKLEFFAPAVFEVDRVAESVLLCPGSDFGVSHEWPLERWEVIARNILQTNKRITVTSVNGGRGLGRKLANRLGDDVEYLQAVPFAQVLPLLAGYEWLIAADGSLPHLAAHAGATCVTLFGPNDPAWKRPLGRRHAVVRRHVECAPCLLAKCPLDGRCQHEMETARVWRAVSEKLA